MSCVFFLENCAAVAVCAQVLAWTRPFRSLGCAWHVWVELLVFWELLTFGGTVEPYPGPSHFSPSNLQPPFLRGSRYWHPMGRDDWEGQQCQPVESVPLGSNGEHRNAVFTKGLTSVFVLNPSLEKDLSPVIFSILSTCLLFWVFAFLTSPL